MSTIKESKWNKMPEIDRQVYNVILWNGQRHGVSKMTVKKNLKISGAQFTESKNRLIEDGSVFVYKRKYRATWLFLGLALPVTWILLKEVHKNSTKT